MTDDTIRILLSLVSALLGGVIVAIVNHLLTRKKTAAEARKLEAEADKIRLETEKLFKEMAGIASTVREVSYKLGEAKEQVIYDGGARLDGADFTGQSERMFGESHDKPKGLGALRIEHDVLNIQRINTAGRFRVTLLRYQYANSVRDYVPKNDLIAGKRLLRVTCEAKVVGGSHDAIFIIKRRQDGAWLAKHEQTFDTNEWTSVDAYLRVPPSEDCFLMIDDQGVSHANSSLQIRRLMLTERSS